MRKPENERAFALRLTVPVLTALSLIFYRVLTASSFESTENVPLVTILLAAASCLAQSPPSRMCSTFLRS